MLEHAYMVTAYMYIHVCNSRIIKHYPASTRQAFQVVLGQKQHPCVHTLDLPNVIRQVHLKRGVAAHRRAKKRTCMSLL